MNTRIPSERESGVRLRADARAEGGDEARRIAESVLAASVGFDVCARPATTKAAAKRMASPPEAARAIPHAPAGTGTETGPAEDFRVEPLLPIPTRPGST